ncbi:hypothetical protein LLG46_01630 [bacterium]|nr:hypothetical protein [bacterium]
MLSNAIPKAVVNHKTCEKSPPHNTNFDILFLAADEGLIDYEDAVNIVLSTTECLGYEHGAYTQVQLDRKIRSENRRMPRIDECAISSEVVEDMLDRILDELIDVSRLTAFQEIVLRLSVSGLTVANIASNLGLSRARTAKALKIARSKTRAAYEQGKYAGWYEVYLSEVNRTRKR